MMQNVLITVPEHLRRNILSAEALVNLHRFANVTMNPLEQDWTGEELAAQLPGMHAVIAGWGLAKLTEEVLAQADRLQIVAYAGGSVKYFVTDTLFERGIMLSHAAHRLAGPVAEFSVMLAMMGLRRPQDFDRRMKAGEAWPVSRDRCVEFHDIAGSKVGLLGMGYVGRRAAELFRGMGADVWVYDPYLSPGHAEQLGICKVELDKLLAECKVISIHLPTTDETHHILGKNELALIQDGAVFVNTARAWVVDQAALVVELAKGRFWAALDVFDPEPLPLDHPLRCMDNVLLTPHVAALSFEAYNNLMADMVDEVERCFNRQPLRHQVTQAMLATMA
jgi:phosphoglycerate dehydrogenase-like enzyme